MIVYVVDVPPIPASMMSLPWGSSKFVSSRTRNVYPVKVHPPGPLQPNEIVSDVRAAPLDGLLRDGPVQEPPCTEGGGEVAGACVGPAVGPVMRASMGAEVGSGVGAAERVALGDAASDGLTLGVGLQLAVGAALSAALPTSGDADG